MCDIDSKVFGHRQGCQHGEWNEERESLSAKTELSFIMGAASQSGRPPSGEWRPAVVPLS